MLRTFSRLSRQHVAREYARQSRRKIHIPNGLLRITEEVRSAVAEKRPVVALESTIYTHGFPYPESLHLANELESLVRSNGGIPATCAVLEGVARVGLEPEELDRLTADREAKKISRRDFGHIIGSSLYAKKKLNGGTTISGTSVLAHSAGIKVFATGGLGGVHRGGESSLDISADLTELGRTPIAVISAGCKGFLDIPRTLEYLETEGVGVGTFADGRSGPVDFPAFWSRDSGVPSPKTIANEAEAAAMIFAQNALGLRSGLFFANPVPAEFEIPRAELAEIIQEALRIADSEGAIGASNTPRVLRAIKELSGGRSIPANRALIVSNITRGTKVAVELSKRDRGQGETLQYDENPVLNVGKATETGATVTKISGLQESQPAVDLLVAGSIALDTACDYSPNPTLAAGKSPQSNTSNPCVLSKSVGGVGHNIAKAAHTVGGSVRLCSAIADDEVGTTILRTAQDSGLDIGGVTSLPTASALVTAQYISFNDADKNLVMAMADMRILEQCSSYFSEEAIDRHLTMSKPSWLVVDANWDVHTLLKWRQRAKALSVGVAFEPVSTAKSTKLFAGPPHSITAYPQTLVDLASPNAMELKAMNEAARTAGLFDREDWWDIIDALGISSAGARTELVNATSAALVDAGVPQQSIQLLPFIPTILTKLGSGGVLLTQLLDSKDERLRSPNAAPYVLSRTKRDDGEIGGVYMRLFPVAENIEEGGVVSVNGAGDTFLGVIMAALTTRPDQPIENVVDVAQAASAMTLKSWEAVSPEIAGLLGRLPRKASPLE